MLVTLLLLWLNPPLVDNTPLIGYQRTVLVRDGQAQMIICCVRINNPVCADILQKQFDEREKRTDGYSWWDYNVYIHWCKEFEIIPDWLPSK